MDKDKILKALNSSESVINYTLETLDKNFDPENYASAERALKEITAAKKELKKN